MFAIAIDPSDPAQTPAYLRCLSSVGISQIGSPGKRVREYHIVVLASEWRSSVSFTAIQATRRAENCAHEELPEMSVMVG